MKLKVGDLLEYDLGDCGYENKFNHILILSNKRVHNGQGSYKVFILENERVGNFFVTSDEVWKYVKLLNR